MSPASPRERRSDLRVAFLPHARPRLILPDGQHDVLNAAPHGLRLRHTDPIRPVAGDALEGALQGTRTGEQHPVSGHITWVGNTDIGVKLDTQPLPVGFVMRELAWLRDQGEGNRFDRA